MSEITNEEMRLMSNQPSAPPSSDHDIPPPPSYSEVTNEVHYPTLPVQLEGPQQPLYPHAAAAANLPMPNTTTVHVIRTTSSSVAFGGHPVEMDCPFCQAQIITATRRSAGAAVWIIFCLCFVLGFFIFIPWFFSYIPFCVDSCLVVRHHCPNCKRVVGARP